nr:hypothetical protein [Tanacetum cinerariifolium]
MSYTKDSNFELTRFLDADCAGCQDSFKSTSGGVQFLGKKLVSWSLKKQESIAISCNSIQLSRTKHIAVRYHFIKEHVENGTIELYFAKTDYQLADIFTKSLPVDMFIYLVCRVDTRPSMLDRTDFASWQQRIRLYYRGKDKWVNILKSIDEGPYKLGTFRETLAESTEGTPQFEPFSLKPTINSEHLPMQGIKPLTRRQSQGMNPQGGSAAGYKEAHNRVGNVNQGQARLGHARILKCYNCNGGPDNAFDDDVDEQPV